MATVAGNLKENLSLTLHYLGIHKYKTLDHKVENQPFWSLTYIQKGYMRTVMADQDFIAKTGDAVILPPNINFHQTAEVEGIHHWLLFDGAIASNLEILRMYPVCTVVPLLAPDDYAQTFYRLMDDCAEIDGPFREIKLLSHTTHLLRMVLESWKHHGQTNRPVSLMTSEDRFIKVIQYMKSHMNKKIKREDLAELVHLHPNYLDRVFHDIYGKTTLQMLRELRLKRTQQLLGGTELTLEAIASECGFVDAAHLTHLFQQYHNETPGQYRKRLRDEKAQFLLQN